MGVTKSGGLEGEVLMEGKRWGGHERVKGGWEEVR